MNNKMVINKYLSTIESKKTKMNKQNKNKLIDIENTFTVAQWEGFRGDG